MKSKIYYVGINVDCELDHNIIVWAYIHRNNNPKVCRGYDIRSYLRWSRIRNLQSALLLQAAFK